MRIAVLIHSFAKKNMLHNFKPIKNQRYIYIILTIICLSCKFTLAQENTTITPGLPKLEELDGYSQTLLYSHGQKERAKSIAVFMENAVTYFESEIGFVPKTQFYILAPKHWKSFAAKPVMEVYGFPHNLDATRLVIAAEDNDFWRSYLPPIQQLPPSAALMITKAYGQEDGSHSMMAFFDLLALHELAHSYASQAGLQMHRNWLSELFANIMLHTFIAEKQKERLPALEAFPNLVVGGGTAEYKHTSLEDFEKLYSTMGMGPKNYGWYQCKLHTAAKEIYNAGGKDTFNKLWKALKIHQEKMSDEELVKMLAKEVHPSVALVFSDWNKNL